MPVRQGLIVGMGNPLLDLSHSVTRDYLEKYKLKDNDAILAEEQHMPIFEDFLKKPDTSFIAGGATLNGIRVAQWILRDHGITSMFGCIKHDEYGSLLEADCKKVGVKTMFQYNQGSEPTGKCAVLILDDKRSLVTDLGSANCFKESHLEVSDHWKVIEDAEFFYSAAFFLTVSPASLMKVAEHSLERNKTMMMNLSAPFLCQFFKDPMMAAFPYIDVIFGNETEAGVFAKEQNFGTEDLKEIALKMSRLPKKSSRPRIAVITCGALPVIVATEDKLEEYPVPTMDPSTIVDTNGAGDAFVGGFISQYVQKKSLAECVACGNAAAQCIIRRSGCSFPSDPADIGY